MPIRVYKYTDEDQIEHFVEELVFGNPPATILVQSGDATYEAQLVPFGVREAGAHGSSASQWAEGREDADLPPKSWNGSDPLK